MSEEASASGAVARKVAVQGDPHSPRSASRVRWLRKWIVVIFGIVAAFLFPWSAYLSYSLPSRHLTPHWNAAWAGFDLFMAVSVIATLVLLLRRSKYVAIGASVTAAFLLCDAWFDIVTSRPGSELVQSVLFALFGELPMAGLCFWLARDADKVCSSATRFLPQRRV
jgi:hypothetical protein